MDQFEKAKTAKNKWKYINEWRSESSPRGWSYSYRIIKAGKIFVVREKKGSVKISELDSNNKDVDRDSFDESDIDESPDSLRPFETLSMHSWPHTVAPRALFCLFSSLSHSCVRIQFSLPHFARAASRKTELQKNYLSAFDSLSALRNTRVFSEIRA